MSGSVVKHERHPDLPPPKTEVGVIGWLYHNLFSSWLNALLTVIGVAIILLIVPPVIEWVFFDGIWQGESRAACESATGALNHPCWVFVKIRFWQFMYGFYPEAERWRIDFSFLLLIMACAPLVLSEALLRKGAGYAAAAAATIVSALAFGWGPAAITAALMLAPYALVFNRLGAVLPRSTDNAAVGPGIRLAVVVAFWIAGYYLGLALLGDAESRSLGWIAAFMAFGLISLNRATVKAWIAFLMIFIYPFIAFFLWSGDGFGLDYVESSLWGGLFLTLVVAGTGIAASLPIGILFALGRRSQMPAIRTVSVAFIELWRGVPLITVLFMSSVMLPLFLPEGVNFDKLLRALIGVALFSAAYVAEVVRGGLQAIPKGQYEAAQAVGLGYWQMMRLIILPQALKLVIPGIVNSFIALFKDTTLVLIIGLFDLLNIIQSATQSTNWLGTAVEGYVFAAVIFWIFCFSMSRYSMYIERKLHTGHRR